MTKTQNKPTQPRWGKYTSHDPVESKRDDTTFTGALSGIGRGTLDSFKDEFLRQTPKDFVNQLFGFERPGISASGELAPGQTIVIEKAVEEQKEENKILQASLFRERQLREEEQAFRGRKTQELKLQLAAITEEVKQLAVTTSDLSEEVKTAASQTPVNPGVYHVVFFEKLLSFIQSFRKKIENASLWLQSQNQLAAKRRRFWGQVGLSGAKRLLSSEDYMVRSAG